MGNDNTAILAVPTNIITGFLGAGKTSAILNLLKSKPADERWAILINEFGEIGVDGSIVQGQSHEDDGVYIREVPGGCMCCTAGLPMQIALTQLLRRARPHRLLIEPTGLGHPLEVLQTLSSDYNRDVLSIQKTLTLVDARNLADERYTSHATFRQQLSIADIVVANKDDLYSEEDRTALQSFVRGVCRPDTQIVHTQYGGVELHCLPALRAPKPSPVRMMIKSLSRCWQANYRFRSVGTLLRSMKGKGSKVSAGASALRKFLTAPAYVTFCAVSMLSV